MTDNAWTRWPSREALGREATTRPRRLLGWVTRSLVLAMLLWGAFSSSRVQGWGVLGAVAGILLSAVVAWALFRTTLEHRLWPSLALYGILLAIAVAAQAADFKVVALVLWCGCAITALERLPIAAALPVTVIALALYAAVNDDVWLTTLATTAGLALAGYVLRLDAEARATRSGCSTRSGPPGRPRRSPRHSRSGPVSPGRSTTCWPTVSRPSSCTWRRPGC